MEGRGKYFFQASTTLPAMRCATTSVSSTQLLPIGQWHSKIENLLHSVMNKIALDFVKNSYPCNFSKYLFSDILIFLVNGSFSLKPLIHVGHATQNSLSPFLPENNSFVSSVLISICSHPPPKKVKAIHLHVVNFNTEI